MDKENISASESLLEQIFYYMNCLVEEKDFNQSMYLLTELGRFLVDAERASFWYKDEQNNVYRTLAAIGAGELVVPNGHGIVGVTVENNRPVITNNPYGDNRFYSKTDKSTGFVTKSILCVPVTNEDGRVIGAYQVLNKQSGDGSFTEADIDRLALAAAYCGKCLEAQLLLEENRIDPLTALKNRKGFYDFYNRYKKKDSAVIMCDIDFFKKVNDTYGHNAGDAVLIHVADILQQSLQTGEEVVRWGGEEFVILLRGKDIARAAEFAESLRQWIEGSYCQYGSEKIRITMSFGVGTLVPQRTSDENIKDVDDKLYQAKTTGRNKVVI